MYPAAFDYHAPGTIKEALDLLGKHKDDAKLLAGGHSLIPMMKLRLAQPKHLIALRKVPGLSGIKQDGNMLAIGAMTTHWEVESSSLVKSKLAVLSEVAAVIGGPAVRNRGAGGARPRARRWLDRPRRSRRGLSGGHDRARCRDGVRGREGPAHREGRRLVQGADGHRRWRRRASP